MTRAEPTRPRHELTLLQRRECMRLFYTGATPQVLARRYRVGPKAICQISYRAAIAPQMPDACGDRFNAAMSARVEALSAEPDATVEGIAEALGKTEAATRAHLQFWGWMARLNEKARAARQAEARAEQARIDALAVEAERKAQIAELAAAQARHALAARQREVGLFGMRDDDFVAAVMAEGGYPTLVLKGPAQGAWVTPEGKAWRHIPKGSRRRPTQVAA